MEAIKLDEADLIMPLQSGILRSGDVVHVFKLRRSDKVNAVLESNTFVFDGRTYVVKSSHLQPGSEGDTITLNCQYH